MSSIVNDRAEKYGEKKPLLWTIERVVHTSMKLAMVCGDENEDTGNTCIYKSITPG